MVLSLLKVIPKYFVTAEANAASLESKPKKAKKAKHHNYIKLADVILHIVVQRSLGAKRTKQIMAG